MEPPGERMTGCLEDLLMQCWADSPDALDKVQQAMEEIRRAKLAVIPMEAVDPRRLATVDLHRKIDALSRAGVSTAMIAVRMDMHRVSVAKIIQTLHRQRKAG